MANKAQRQMFILVEKVQIPMLHVLLIYLGCARNFMGMKQTIFCQYWTTYGVQWTWLGVAFGTDKGIKAVFSTRQRDLALRETEQSINVEPLSKGEG